MLSIQIAFFVLLYSCDLWDCRLTIEYTVVVAVLFIYITVRTYMESKLYIVQNIDRNDLTTHTRLGVPMLVYVGISAVECMLAETFAKDVLLTDDTAIIVTVYDVITDTAQIETYITDKSNGN